MIWRARPITAVRVGVGLVALVACSERVPGTGGGGGAAGDGGNGGGSVPEHCGDGILNVGEVCDGTDFGDRTCVSEGFEAGELRCTAACDEVSTSGCFPVCGNGVTEGAEHCDGDNLGGTGSEDCDSLGFDGGALHCSPTCTFDTRDCNGLGPWCGDGIIAITESCDAGNLGGHSCSDVGFDSGTLACEADCTWDTSGCSGCGNGIIEGNELCDDTNTGDVDCMSRGFGGGELMCASLCNRYDFTNCVDPPTQECGNGVLEGDEACDGQVLEIDCPGLFDVYVGGTLYCASNCLGYDQTECSMTPICGDGIVQAGEVCDGEPTSGIDCGFVGWFAGGELTCLSDCSGFDISGCEPPLTCGNGVTDGAEYCDGDAVTQWVTAGCEMHLYGLDSGALACNPDCTLDFSDCTPVDRCAAAGSYTDYYCTECELLGGYPDPGCDLCGLDDGHCPSLFSPRTGVFTCPYSRGVSDPDCRCGDGVINSGEVCDGSAVKDNCIEMGFAGGEPGCADCRLDFSGCDRCADSADCTDAERSTCNQATGMCIQCNDASDCGPGDSCWKGLCYGSGPLGSPCELYGRACETRACLYNWPDGYCSNNCQTDAACAAAGHCSRFGYCVVSCSGAAQCRSGYSCYNIDGDSRTECAPLAVGDGQIGDPCEDRGECAGGASGGCFSSIYGGPEWPGGYCAMWDCADDDDCPAGSHCSDTTGEPGSTGVCLKDCTVATETTDCRTPEYGCHDYIIDISDSLECAPVGSGIGAVGDACTAYADCGGGPYGMCKTDPGKWPGGYCTIRQCADRAICPAGSHCSLTKTDGGVCTRDCVDNSDCRGPNYECYDYNGDGLKECMGVGLGPGRVGATCASIVECAPWAEVSPETGGRWARCLLDLPGGYCSSWCDAGLGCPPGSICNDPATRAAECLRICSTDDDCRPGYVCIGGVLSAPVCYEGG